MNVEMYSEDKVIITGVCPFCGKTWEAIIPSDGFIEWNEGMPIQYALPHISATVRELLISGICEACQEKIFD